MIVQINCIMYKVAFFAGVVSTVAGSTVSDYVDGVGTVAKFNNPNGISVDSTGNAWVADQYNHMIRKIAAPCAVGSYWTGSACAVVPAGYYQPQGAVSNQYYACAAGSYSLGGATSCSACAAYWVSEAASSYCRASVSCPAGTYISSAGCAVVPTGETQNMKYYGLIRIMFTELKQWSIKCGHFIMVV